jgi:DNA replication protein DnaC
MTAEPAEIWHAERRAKLAANLIASRPAAFAAEGELHPELASWADALAAGDGRNLLLNGPVGTGKTWSVWHAAERAVAAGYEGAVAICPSGRFRRILAPATADPAEYDRLESAGLLALDDIGSVRLSEWDMDHLSELIDSRSAALLPTVITSNKADIRALLGPRIASRLAYRAVTVTLSGPDRRRQS